jgi:phospholipase C
VGFVANTIGASQYWLNAAIIVVWDDWGGWYDGVIPQTTGLTLGGTTIAATDLYNSANRDPYEYGYRVPMLVISPWVKQGVDSTPRSTASILDFIEHTFGVTEGSLGTLDSKSLPGHDDLHGMFNFQQTALPPPNEKVTGFPTQCISPGPDIAPEPNDGT